MQSNAIPDMIETSVGPRLCFRSPVPEIALAARLLDDAVTAHQLGQFSNAELLIKMADMPVIRDWTESVWGKSSPYVQRMVVLDAPAVLESAERSKSRMPSEAEKRALIQRDGYHCRFCQVPVIRSETRKLIRHLYSEALPRGQSNISQHAAFQAMWLQYDHVLPHARAREDGLNNFVITCAACNFGRMESTLAEVGLQDPRDRAPFHSSWDGLEGLHTTQTVQSILVKKSATKE